MGGIPLVLQRSPNGSVRKALLWILCLLVLLVGITVFLLYRAAGAVPTWYLPPDSLATSQPAREAENILIEIQTWAGARYAWDYARSTGRRPVAMEPDQRLTITLTDAQVNALLQKWFPIYSQSVIGNKPLKDSLDAPMVRFTRDRITMAATLLDMNSRIISIDLSPQALPDGQFTIGVPTVHMGTLTLPEFAWSKSRDKMVGDLSRAMPDLRGKAAIDPGGGANVACIAAIGAAQAIAALEHRPATNALPLPIVAENIALPVHIESVEVQDGRLTVTIRAMTPEERQQLLTRVRNGPND